MLLRVADKGPGFAGAMLAQLPLSTTKPSGSGIDLYVARTTAEHHGGSLSLGRSASLGGAEVTLELPAA